MRNFHKIAAGIDIAPLLHAISRQPELWDVNRLRTSHELTPHKAVSDIWLRFNDLKPYEATGDAAAVLDEHESINYPALASLPQARPIIFNLMRFVEAERLGRVLITRLAPGKRIDPHSDGGSHAAYYDRYHVVLQASPGSLFRCGGEQVQMAAGEIWWFRNELEHEVINNGADDRIHLIVDLRTAK